MAARKINPMGRSRKPGNGYIKTVDPRYPGWTWEVLKTYKLDPTGDGYARAFAAVSSPFTGGSFDLGDTYIREIGRTIVEFDRSVFASVDDARLALFGR